jgi:1-acyl-sn-glycerol-3-phosphate acyltransferase
MSRSEWQYESAADLDQSLIERLGTFPRKPDMLVYGLRLMAALCLRGYLHTYHRLQISGRENLPATGSFVMVANHSSHLDALCLLSALPLRKLHQAYPAAAQDYFFVSLPAIACSAIFINALPFSRQAALRQSLDLCRRLLAEPGHILILFPEGTRSVEGKTESFRSGIGLLVAGSEIPVVPCALQGAWQAWPKGRTLPRPRKIRLALGKPRVYAQTRSGRKAADAVAQDLQTAVEELLCK